MRVRASISPPTRSARCTGGVRFSPASPLPAAPVSLVRIDGQREQITALVRDAVLGRGHWGNLWAASGTLWQLVGQEHGRLAERNIRTGRVVQTLPLGVDACTCHVAFGFGSVWLLRQTVYFTGTLSG